MLFSTGHLLFTYPGCVLASSCVFLVSYCAEGAHTRRASVVLVSLLTLSFLALLLAHYCLCPTFGEYLTKALYSPGYPYLLCVLCGCTVVFLFSSERWLRPDAVLFLYFWVFVGCLSIFLGFHGVVSTALLLAYYDSMLLVIQVNIIVFCDTELIKKYIKHSKP